MESEDSRTRLQNPVKGYAPLEMRSHVEEVREHRFSAFVDGIFIGVGMVCILLGVLMSITNVGMLFQGLLSIIGGLVVLAVGTVVEVHHWAKLQ